METSLILFALLAGGLLPVQAAANAQLAKTIGSPYAATAIQLLLAAALLLAIAAIAGSIAPLTALPTVPWWHALGGLASAFYVLSGIVLFPRLGAVMTVGLFIAGQMLASVMLDASGALGVEPKDLNAAALTGIALVLVGTAAIVFGQRGERSSEQRGQQLPWVLLALAAGAILPVQGAVNALLRADLGEPLAVGAISFVVATIGMALVLVLMSISANRPDVKLTGLAELPWWGWLGAIVGAVYVVTVFIALPAIGAATTIGLTIAGQQVMSLLVDRNGWLRLPQRHVSPLRLAGVALLLAGVALILIF